MKFLSKGTLKSLTPEQKESGAGLGLVTALKNANKLVFLPYEAAGVMASLGGLKELVAVTPAAK